MKGMNFNLIIQFSSFYILKILFNMYFKDEKKSKLNFAVHMFASYSHSEPWHNLVIFSYI